MQAGQIFVLLVMEYQLYTLSNGLRIVHKPNKSNLVHACIVLNCGTRDEPADKVGLAHFMEHMLFKGTSNRSSYHILNRLEVVGGELNAYTTKEYTCLHASFLKQHTERAFELLSDVLLNSTFPQKEIEKEKEVVMDEIDSYLDLPEEAIQDEFEAMVFAKHPLGENILGTKESLAKIKATDLRNYSKSHFVANNMVLGVYGDLSETALLAMAVNYFSSLKSKEKETREKPGKYKPQGIIRSKNCVQTHAIMGSRAPSFHHRDKNAMILLSNYLGGPGMSSRLNMELREKKGICYTIDANYSPWTDTGMFSIYLGTDREKIEKAVRLVQSELKRICEKKLSPLALHQAKQKLIGQISLSEENHLSVIIALCKSIVDYGKADNLEEIFQKIEKVSAEEVLALSNEIFDSTQLSSLIYMPA